MTEDDGWVRVAMAEDTVVVDMLLKLKQGCNSHTKLPAVSPPPVLRLDWTVRQRRSKPLLKKNRASSPTTPLSWSGATTSGSGGGGDGFEESSQAAKPADAPRSKVQVAVASNAPTIKRSRKKKTLAELREEESLLQKERINLKEQLITLRLNVEKQKAENLSLKKLKLDLLSCQTVETVPASLQCKEAKLNQPQQKMEHSNPSCLIFSASVACNKLDPSPAISGETLSHQLPDLNIPAGEDDSSSTFPYGLS